MKLLETRLPNDHNMFDFGDLHDGAGLSSKSGWNKLCNMMLSEYAGCKNNYGAEGGDDIEAIMVDDKRADAEKIKEEPFVLTQIDNAIKIRQPIKHLILYKLKGNHEDKLWRFGDIMAKICDELGVPYGTYTCKLTVNDKRGKLMYKQYDAHGAKNITSTADDPERRHSNERLILKRHLRHKAGDCAVMIKHHTHKLIVCTPEPELYLVDDGKKIRQHYTSWGQNEPYIHPDARWYGNAGSFLRLHGDGVSGYAEKYEYDPVELGFLVLKVRDKRIVGLDKVVI